MLYICHICLHQYWGMGQGGGAVGSSVVKERETGGQDQFYWMLDDDSCMAQPIGFQLVSL
jgi:hypothetical protein